MLGSMKSYAFCTRSNSAVNEPVRQGSLVSCEYTIRDDVSERLLWRFPIDAYPCDDLLEMQRRLCDSLSAFNIEDATVAGPCRVSKATLRFDMTGDPLPRLLFDGLSLMGPNFLWCDLRICAHAAFRGDGEGDGMHAVAPCKLDDWISEDGRLYACYTVDVGDSAGFDLLIDSGEIALATGKGAGIYMRVLRNGCQISRGWGYEPPVEDRESGIACALVLSSGRPHLVSQAVEIDAALADLAERVKRIGKADFTSLRSYTSGCTLEVRMPRRRLESVARAVAALQEALPPVGEIDELRLAHSLRAEISVSVHEKEDYHPATDIDFSSHPLASGLCAPLRIRKD